MLPLYSLIYKVIKINCFHFYQTIRYSADTNFSFSCHDLYTNRSNPTYSSQVYFMCIKNFFMRFRIFWTSSRNRKLRSSSVPLTLVYVRIIFFYLRAGNAVIIIDLKGNHKILIMKYGFLNCGLNGACIIFLENVF